MNPYRMCTSLFKYSGDAWLTYKRYLTDNADERRGSAFCPLLVPVPHTDDDAEAVTKTSGASSLLPGFYSCGEISPFHNGSECHLPNQIITITSFYELA